MRAEVILHKKILTFTGDSTHTNVAFLTFESTHTTLLKEFNDIDVNDTRTGIFLLEDILCVVGEFLRQIQASCLETFYVDS